METNAVKIKDLPAPQRGGKRKPSGESLAFQEKILTCDAFKLDGTFEKADADTITQRIRSAAARVGMKVKIRHQEGEIFFQGFNPEAE